MTMVRLKTKTENAVNLASRVLAPLALAPLRRYIDPCEAASRVRSHISPGPYRSFRELSLAGSVDPDIWCPPTFVGNSGIERFNGDRGFALFSRWSALLAGYVRPSSRDRRDPASARPRCCVGINSLNSS